MSMVSIMKKPVNLSGMNRIGAQFRKSDCAFFVAIFEIYVIIKIAENGFLPKHKIILLRRIAALEFVL